jgi:hypothetical protein
LNKRKRGAKNKTNPTPGDPAKSANSAPVVPQAEVATVAVAEGEKVIDSTNNSKSKAATPILPPHTKPAAIVVAKAAKPVVAADDGFVDLRAPKKKKRSRKSNVADNSLNSNASDHIKAEAITEQEAKPHVDIGNNELKMEHKSITMGEVQEGGIDKDTTSRRKRKRSAQAAKKSLSAEEQTDTSILVDAPATNPAKLNADETSSEAAPASLAPTAQPLSEIQPPNSASTKRRKRGSRKSSGEDKSEAKIAVMPQTAEALVAIGDLKEHHS